MFRFSLTWPFKVGTLNLPVVEILRVAVDLGREFLDQKLHSLEEGRSWWGWLFSH